MQKVLHPDKYAQSSPQERDLSAANSAIVNAAYQTLRSPLERLKYVLRSQGVDVLGETSATLTDPALLMEVMELREDVEAAAASKTALEELSKASQASIDATLALLSADFAAGDFEGLGANAVRLQYYTKIQEEVQAAMGDLER
jgi:molecular chaperone HscB